MTRSTAQQVVAIGARIAETDRNVSVEKWRAFAEACLRFSPRLALREEGVVFLDLRGITFDQRTLSLRIRALAERMGFVEARAIFAPCAWAALAELRGKTGLDALEEILAPFAHDEDLARVARKMRDAFSLLGLDELSKVAHLPVGELASRFGASGIEVWRRIQGLSDPPWPVFTAPERIVESEDFEAVGFCESLEGLLFPLRALIDRAMARLRGRGERASVLRVRLKLERGAPVPERRWELRLPLPQGASAGVLPIVRERLFFDVACAPLMARVQTVIFEVTESVPGRGSQRDFFSRKEEDQEALESLVGRLASTLGQDSVFRAAPVERHLPESAWKRRSREEVLSAPVPLPSLLPEALPDRALRPTRLLKRPVPLFRHGSWIRTSRREWEAVQWEGPERVSTEWWSSGEAIERDYFRVRTREGELLWIFARAGAQEGRYYLHGYFD